VIFGEKKFHFFHRKILENLREICFLKSKNLTKLANFWRKHLPKIFTIKKFEEETLPTPAIFFSSM
jgi:hypothetical protein